MADGLDEQARLGVAGDDRGPGLAALADGVARVQAEVALQLFRLGAVAGVAFLHQNGADPLLEELVVGRLGLRQDDEQRDHHRFASFSCFSLAARWRSIASRAAAGFRDFTAFRISSWPSTAAATPWVPMEAYRDARRSPAMVSRSSGKTGLR